MPLTVYVLGLSIFALGTSEFMLAGLLPSISTELAVSIPDAGLLISAYAVGMLVGAPLLAVALHRVPRKAALVGTLAVFGLSHVVGALAPGYALLFTTRVVAALACAGFWAVAAATTVALVPADRRGRAMSIVTGGLTVAMIAGVPLGTALGQSAGWRATFWALAAASALVLAGVVALVPSTALDPHRPRLATELAAYRSPRVWLALGVTAVSTAAITVCFSYLSPLLTDDIGVTPGWVPVGLALYGAGALAGILTGGRVADVRPLSTIAAANVGAAVALGALALSPAPPIALVAATLLGFAGFAANPALNARVFSLADSAPSLAGASNVAAFNVGIVAAPWLGGLTIDAGLGYGSVTWVGIALAVVALAATALAATPRRRARPLVPAATR